jgi:hypothetical protein
MIISHWIVLVMRNVSEKLVVRIKTHFVFSKFSSDNRAIFEIMQKNVVELDRPQMKVSRMRMSRCVPVATNTDSQYVILFASPLQICYANPPHYYILLLCYLIFYCISFSVIFFFFAQCDIFLNIIYLDLKIDRVLRSSAQFCRN